MILRKLFIIFSLSILINCQYNSFKKSKINPTKSNNDFKVILNFEKEDIPSFIDFVYNQKKNLIIGKIAGNNFELQKFLLFYEVKKHKYSFWGEPGQGPVNTPLLFSNFGILKNTGTVYFTCKHKCIKIFDYNCNLIASIFSEKVKGGKVFMYEEKLFNFDDWLNPDSEYICSVFSLTNNSLIKNIIKTKTFIKLSFNNNSEDLTSYKIGKSFTQKTIHPIRICVIDKNKILLSSSTAKIKNIIEYSIKENKYITIPVEPYLEKLLYERWRKYDLIVGIKSIGEHFFVGINLPRVNKIGYNYVFLMFNKNGRVEKILSHKKEWYGTNESSILTGFSIKQDHTFPVFLIHEMKVIRKSKNKTKMEERVIEIKPVEITKVIIDKRQM